MNFQDNIKKWVALDNQIKSLNDKAKHLREEKNEMEEGFF